MSESTPEAPKRPTRPLHDAPKPNTDSGRFAVYDRTEARFVGSVHDDKAAATKAAPKVEGHVYVTVEV